MLSRWALMPVLAVALGLGCAQKPGATGVPPVDDAGLAGDSDSGEDAPSDAGAGDASVVIPPDAGEPSPDGGADATTVTAVVSAAEGGTVRLPDGAQVVIPPGALAQDTAITLSATDLPAPGGYSPFSKVYRFEPDGLQFLKPVAVTIPFQVQPGQDPRVATIFWSNGDAGSPERLSATIHDGMATVYVTHF